MRDTLTKFAVPCFAVSLLVMTFRTDAFADRPRGHQPAQVKKPAPIAPSGETKRTTIGDIVISGHQKMAFDVNFSSVKISGPNTTVEVPDKRSGSHLLLHGDNIMLISPRSADQGRVEIRGHLRYSVTQQTPEGERKLEGTAGQGNFYRKTHKIELSSGVQCELTDPRLVGTGTLHAGSVTADISATPYLYTFEGDSATNDIQFTPKPRDPKQRPEAQIGPVHVHHWDSGTFQTGKVAKFDGTLAVADLRSAAGAPQGQLRARHLQGDFAPSGEIIRAQAVDNVHYHIDRAAGAADGKAQSGRQEVTGTCDQAAFDPAASQFVLDGNIDATLVNTLSLTEPARLQASRLVVTEVAVGKSKTALQYELTGAPNHRRLQFTPRSPEPKAGASDATESARPTFTFGKIILTGFQTGVLEPGKKLDLASDGKQELLLDTSDAKTLSASHLETHHFTAALAEDGGITQAETAGPVTFHIQQAGPGKNKKAGADGAQPAAARRGALQSLDGNSARAIYRKNGQQQIITLDGPFTTRVTDPEHLASPGTAKGVKDDSLSLDLLSREFSFDSPHETIVLDFVPRELETEASATPAPPAPPKRK